MKKKFKKVAIIHDVFIENGGAERVLLSIISMFPEADIFVPLLSDDNKKLIEKETSGKVFSSFFNHIPLIHSASILLKPFLYLYWELLDLSGYDLVITSSHSFSSKGVITSADALHISYIHTPPRYLYAEFNETQILKNKFFRVLLTPLLSWLRQKDFVAAQRPDVLVANSKEIQRRIKKYYRRDSRLVYPPVQKFVAKNTKSKKEYYVCFSRLAKQKGMDLIIKTFNKTKKKLVVIGRGSQREYLESIAGSNIRFLGYVEDKNLAKVFLKAKALVYGSIEEDFGIVPVESLGMGVPVIAFYSGGVKEIVTNRTGVFFKERTEQSLLEALRKFEKKKFLKKDCKNRAALFSEKKFKAKLLKVINSQK